MKINNIFKSAVFALAVGTVAGVTSCNYLDVVPPEQPGLEDAMKTHATAQGFLYSCYAGLNDRNLAGGEYQDNGFNGSTDEWVMPAEQEASYGTHFAAAKNTQTTSLTNIKHLWGSMYHYIGQCLLFESQLKTLGREYQVTESDAEEREWLAETRFLKAFYHYCLMSVYGPVPLTTERIPMDLDASEYGGRFHMDYLAKYLANEFDLAAQDLPATRESNEFGRATKVIAKAMKARLLLLVASPLYNGEFPYPDWKNPKFETDGYGRELVSHKYDRKKWEDAYEAVDDAINEAIMAGHSLMTDYNEESNVTLASMNWVPVDIADETQKEEFLRKIMLNRYIHSTSQSENPEILWSLRRTIQYVE
ncbi:MAG: RagB/SusD family nutrient uptake outer membrane protein, partial [Muribaculaceae bacterium]|nr:RagB/SusD family nutrient uptake outer membrane protein [Muribaculaceae bacterium]